MDLELSFSLVNLGSKQSPGPRPALCSAASPGVGPTLLILNRDSPAIPQ